MGDLAVTEYLFGSGDSPGLMGTGHQRFNKPYGGYAQPKRDANGNAIVGYPQQHPGEKDEDYLKRVEKYLFEGEGGDVVYETDPYKAWQDPRYEQNKRNLSEAAVQLSQRRVLGEGTSDPNTKVNRADLERYSGANISPIERMRAAEIGQIERGQAAQLAQAERVGDINIGQANQALAAQARAAQLGRQDAEFRAGQTQLMGQLQDQAAGRGPSLAGSQYQEAAERNIASQMGAAAAMGGRNAGLAQRQLAAQAAAQGQQTARDVSNIRMQEQMAARQQLQGITQTGREQDINVARTQAELQQQTALANMQAQQQTNLTNVAALNERQMQQAQLNAQLRLANQQAGNQFALQQGQFGQQMNLANMQAFNERQWQQAQLQQQALSTNAQAYNQRALEQARLQQQAGLANQQYSNQALFANQQAALQNQQLNDAMLRYYTEAGLSLDARQQQAMMAYSAMQAQQDLGYAGLSQKAYEANREGTGGFMGGIGGMIGMAAMSDEEVKSSVTRGNDQISSFLDQYMSGQQDMVNAALAPEQEKSGGGGLFGGMSGGMSSAKAMSAMSSGGGAAAGAAAASDNKVKDLSAENKQLSDQNDKLKAIAIGQSMSQGAGGKGFFGGLGAGMAQGAKQSLAQDQQKAAAAKTAPKKDPSVGMTPVMNNPNMAISMPAGTTMPSQVGGGIIRQDPYGAPPIQTWGVPAAAPPPMVGDTSIIRENPYDATAYSPIGMKQGISSGNMQVANFLNTFNKAGSGPSSGPSNPMDYSDKSTKKEIDNAIDDKLKNFLSNQHAYEYEYKDEYKDMPGAGHGRFVSPMAQDLAKTDLGKSAVKPDPNGKLQVDYGKLGGIMMASLAYLNERLNEVESKKGKK